MVTLRGTIAERNAGGPEFKYIPEKIVVEVGFETSISDIANRNEEMAGMKLDTRPVRGSVMSKVEAELQQLDFDTKQLNNIGVIVAETDRLSSVTRKIKNADDKISRQARNEIQRLESRAENTGNLTILDNVRPGILNFEDSQAAEFEAKLRNKLNGDLHNPVTNAIEDIGNIISAEVLHTYNTPGPRNLGVDPFDEDKKLEPKDSDLPDMGDLNKRIKVDKAWQVDTGENAVVAIFDTSFSRKLLESDRVIDTFHGDDVDSAYSKPEEGHGTMTAYSAAGNKLDTETEDNPDSDVSDTEFEAKLDYNGVAKDAELLLARLSDDSGALSYTTEAWDWLANWIKTLDKPVISNHSYGIPVCGGRGMNLCSSTVAALSVALSKRDDHQAVYAAGNEGYYCGHRLSGITNGVAGVNSKSASLTIAAFRYDINDAQGYSSHGFGTCGSQLDNPKPDLGTMIPTIVPFADGEKNMESETGGSSGGTSLASPIVAGTAALVASITGNARQSVIQGTLESTASRVRRTQINTIRGHDARFGNGQLQPEAAVKQSRLLKEQKPPNAVFTYEPTELTMGEQVTFDASGTTDPNEDIQLYEWAFGDGTTATGKTVTHTYETGGEKNVTLRVTDSVEKQSTYEQALYINSSPDATFSVSNTDAFLEDTIRFDASNSIDPDNDITSYQWAFGDGTQSQGEVVTHSYNQSGQYNVQLQVTDSLGNTDGANVNVNITAKPEAQFELFPTSPKEGQTIIFDASKSSDPDQNIASYNWNFGDGNTASGEAVTHSYSTFGDYTATLEVEDNDGNISTATKEINTSGIPSASYNYSPQTPTTSGRITFDASPSSDPDGNIISYNWNFSDGTTKTGQTVKHQFNNPQQFDVELTVEDQDGNTETETQSIAVGASPVVEYSYSPTNPNPNDTVQFDASETTDADNNIQSYNWTFIQPNGTRIDKQGISVSHTYQTSGTYRVSLSVQDTDGNVDTTRKEINVTAPPQAAFSYQPAQPTTSSVIELDASQSQDPDGEITLYTWNIQNETATKTGQINTHMFQSTGSYMVDLTVQDESGNTDETSQTITVTQTTGDPGGGTREDVSDDPTEEQQGGGQGIFKSIEDWKETIQVD